MKRAVYRDDSSGDSADLDGNTLHTVPAGGTAGQVLAKQSGTDFDVDWDTPSGGSASVTFGTPAPTWSTVDGIGSSGKALQSDATFALFLASLPSTQAFGDSASAGTVAFPARLDHKHAMPAGALGTANFGTPSPTWSTTAAIGSSGLALQSNATLPVFDATVPTTFAYGDAAATGSAAFAARRDHTHGVPLGGSVLLYDYTVAGTDKASIDTGVDTPDAGSAGTAAFPSGRVLEIFLYLRTDETGVQSTVDLTFNNDGSSIYDRQFVQGQNTSASANKAAAAASFQFAASGASAAAGYFSANHLTVANYAGTVGNKIGHMLQATFDTTSTNLTELIEGFGYRSTSAITRLKIIPDTSGKKFKVGTRVLIYAR